MITKKYLFIPLELEITLSNFQTAWLENSQTAFMICTGVYKKTEFEQIAYSTSIVNQEDEQIMSFIKTNNNNFVLVGFCVEAHQKDIPTLPPQIPIFETAEGFLEFVNTL